MPHLRAAWFSPVGEYHATHLGKNACLSRLVPAPICPGNSSPILKENKEVGHPNVIAVIKVGRATVAVVGYRAWSPLLEHCKQIGDTYDSITVEVAGYACVDGQLDRVKRVARVVWKRLNKRGGGTIEPMDVFRGTVDAIEPIDAATWVPRVAAVIGQQYVR